MVGGFDVTFVEIERDRPCGDVEYKFAIRAFVVFPAAMRGREKIVDELLDGFPDADGRALRFAFAPLGAGELDFGGGQGGEVFASLHLDIFDLATIATSVEADDDECGAGGRRRLE